MVNGVGRGYITADRCSSMTAAPQAKSNGTIAGTAAIANLAVVPIDSDGSFCIFAQLPVDLVVDIQGASLPTGASSSSPFRRRTRVLDTRPPPSPGTSCTSVVHIGDSTSVGMISPSILPDPADRVDAQYRRVGVEAPRMEISGARSIVETLAGQINARDTAAAIKAAGYEGCWVFALGTTDTANVAVGGGVGRRERMDEDDGRRRRRSGAVGERAHARGSGAWSNPNMQLWN